MAPSDWPATRLGDVAEIAIGGTPSRSRPEFWAKSPEPEGHPWASIADLSVRKVTQTKERITDLGVRHSNVKPVEPGTVLMSFKLTIGRTAFAGVHLYTNEAIAAFRPRPQLDPEFLYHALPLAALSGDADVAIKGMTLNKAKLVDLPLRLPPLAEQRKIAAILSSVDETIEKTEAVIAQLEALQESLLHDEIHRALAGAPPCSIGDLAEFGNGRGFSPEEWSDQGLPIIRIQNLNGRREFNHYAGVAKDEWLVHPGDLLFAWAGSRGASFGPCIWRGPVGVLNQHIYRVLPSAGVDRDFLYWLLVFVTREVEQRAHGFKQTLVHLKKGELTSWPAGLPTLAVQVLLAERLGSLAQRIEAERQVLAATQGLKGNLSDGLLSGGVLAPCEVVAS